MNAFIDFLSGEVPGGILLLCLILLIINLSLFFLYKGSKLFKKEVYRTKVIKSSAFISVSEFAKSKKLYMRDAAYVIAVNRVAQACSDRGWV